MAASTGPEDLLAGEPHPMARRRRRSSARRSSRRASGREPPVIERRRRPRARRRCSASTCSRCASNATGPISVSGSSGSPSRIARARSASRADELVVDRVLDEQPRAGHAGLAGGREDARHDAVGRGLEVGVGEHDVRRLAAQLQATRARGATAAPRITARAGRRSPPVKATLSTPGMRDQRRARVLAEAGDDVEHAGREAGLLDQLGELERRGRRLLGRLDDHAAAGGQRRRELPAHQQHRRVPRRDRGDHADRLAQRVDRRSRPVGGDRLAADLVGRPREVVVVVGQPAQLALHLADQLAVVGALDDRDPRGVRGDQLGQPAHQPRPLGAGRAPPALERGPRRAHRRVDVLGAGPRHRRPRPAGERIDGLERLARARGHPLAADQHPVLRATERRHARARLRGQSSSPPPSRAVTARVNKLHDAWNPLYCLKPRD